MAKFIYAIVFLLSISVTTYGQQPSDDYVMRGEPEPHMQFQKGQSPHSSRNSTSSPLLKYHGGSILSMTPIYSILWGADWNSASFAGDKIAGIDRFFEGFSGSSYAKTSNEYYDSTSFITPFATYAGHTIDTAAPPSRAPKVSALVSEVCKMTSNNPDQQGVYVVFTSTKAGNVNYCAWHSWGNCSNGKQVQVAYIPNLDGIAGCDPQDNASGNSQGLAAIMNVTAHELLESITDPRGSAWYDSSGEENGDKCAWSFPSGDGLSTLSNNAKFKLQMEWSNAAYNNGTGLLNRSGQKGCIY